MDQCEPKSFPDNRGKGAIWPQWMKGEGHSREEVSTTVKTQEGMIACGRCEARGECESHSGCEAHSGVKLVKPMSAG